MALLLEEVHWFFSLFIHWIEWIALFSVGILFLVPWLKRFKILTGLVSLSLILLFLFKSYSIWNPEKGESISPKKNEKGLNIYFANLKSNNSEKDKLIQFLQSESPDIVMVVETNNSWIKTLKSLGKIYPYSKLIPKEGNFGMAVLSKTELINERVYVDRENMIPALLLSAKSKYGELNLVLLHAFPPIGYFGTVTRNQYLLTLSRKIGEMKSPLVVCGDLNTTPWSSVYKKFLEHSHLKSSYNKFFRNTWPTSSFVPGIPIDHCFARGLKIIKYELGPDIGSDHFPLMLRGG